MFEDLCLAMNVLNVSEEMRDGLFQTVSAILWIGNVSFEDLDGESSSVRKNTLQALDNAAAMLGIPSQQLRYLTINRQITVRVSPHSLIIITPALWMLSIPGSLGASDRDSLEEARGV